MGSIDLRHFLSGFLLLVAQDFSDVLLVQFLVDCANPGLTVVWDFLRLLCDSDYSVLNVIWLESEHID